MVSRPSACGRGSTGRVANDHASFRTHSAETSRVNTGGMQVLEVSVLSNSFKGWKTTLGAWVTAGLVNLLPYLQDGKFDRKTLAVGFLIGVIGTFLKDPGQGGKP